MSLDRWDCPRCHRALETRVIADHPLHVCVTCGGIAFEKPSEALLYELQHRDTLRALASALDAGATVQVEGSKLEYLHCPRCSGPLARQNFERASGFIIDRCIRHGAWFDQTEVVRGLAFLERGGLEKKAAIEHREAEYLYEQKMQMRRIEAHTTTFRGRTPQLEADALSRWLGFGKQEDFPPRPPRPPRPPKR